MDKLVVELEDGSIVKLTEKYQENNKFYLMLRYKENFFSRQITKEIIKSIFPDLELYEKVRKSNLDNLYKLLNNVICNCYYLDYVNQHIVENKYKNKVVISINKDDKHIHREYSRLNISRLWAREVFGLVFNKENNGFTGEFCGSYSHNLDLSIIPENITFYSEVDEDSINILSCKKIEDKDAQLIKINKFYFEYFKNNQVDDSYSYIKNHYDSSYSFFTLSRSKKDTEGKGRCYSAFVGMNKKLREAITVQGKSLCSVDMKSAFAYIAAATQNIQLSGDFYDVEGVDRKISKKMFNFMMNCNRINKSHILNSKDMRELEATKEDIQLCIDHYSNIGWFRDSEFYKNKESFFGLSQIEADIVIGVVEELADKKILAIPVHDAIYCLPEDVKVIEETIKRRYTEYFKNNYGYDGLSIQIDSDSELKDLLVEFDNIIDLEQVRRVIRKNKVYIQEEYHEYYDIEYTLSLLSSS